MSNSIICLLIVIYHHHTIKCEVENTTVTLEEVCVMFQTMHVKTGLTKDIC